VSTVAELWDDDELLAALRGALRARQAVPPEFVAAGKSAFAWHNIDAELAQLTYDSERDAESAPSRSEAASVRALTFSSPHLTVELEVTPDALVGQIVPIQAGTVEVVTGTGQAQAVSADEIGCFSISPIPAAPFRLRCRTATGIEALTGWITL
jgi:hypothetical protein